MITRRALSSISLADNARILICPKLYSWFLVFLHCCSYGAMIPIAKSKTESKGKIQIRGIRVTICAIKK